MSLLNQLSKLPVFPTNVEPTRVNLLCERLLPLHGHATTRPIWTKNVLKTCNPGRRPTRSREPLFKQEKPTWAT